MKKPDITPGPWKMDIMSDEEFVIEQDVDGWRSMIAIVQSLSLEGDEIKANGDLIAAAPDLAEALDWLVTGLRHRDMEDLMPEGYQMAVAALLKAGYEE